MANQDQLDILKEGVDNWNKWRNDHPEVEIDLTDATLAKLDLRKADFKRAKLSGASFHNTDLREADFRQATIGGRLYNNSRPLFSDLPNRDNNGLKADFNKANLRGAYFMKADLSGVLFINADLREARLSNTDLSNAYLSEANLSGANLWGANLSQARVELTNFGNVDLSVVHNLEAVVHIAPSILGMDTIRRSNGKIPESFLRGCGLSDMDIEYAKLYNPDLTNEQILNIQYRLYDLRATRAVQVSPLFISYSHADTPFVDRLDKTLVEKGVRFWRDIHDMTVGRMETQIDRAIRQNPTVLLVLSKNSLTSDWVQHEVRKARELEKEFGRDALCPVALDDSWKYAPWPARIMEQIMEYNILDFSGWEDKSIFQAQFSRLLSGLDLFYKKPEK